MEQSSFDATVSALDAETSALDVETSAFRAATSAIAQRSFDATISALNGETSSLDAETSALGAATSAIARSYRRYRCGVYGAIGDCGVGITPQMCNRVTNHGDMSTFSKPGRRDRRYRRERDPMLNSILNGGWSNSVPGRQIPEGSSGNTWHTCTVAFLKQLTSN